jgi:hypothetical protein
MLDRQWGALMADANAPATGVGGSNAKTAADQERKTPYDEELWEIQKEISGYKAKKQQTVSSQADPAAAKYDEAKYRAEAVLRLHRAQAFKLTRQNAAQIPAPGSAALTGTDATQQKLLDSVRAQISEDRRQLGAASADADISQTVHDAIMAGHDVKLFKGVSEEILAGLPKNIQHDKHLLETGHLEPEEEEALQERDPVAYKKYKSYVETRAALDAAKAQLALDTARLQHYLSSQRGQQSVPAISAEVSRALGQRNIELPPAVTENSAGERETAALNEVEYRRAILAARTEPSPGEKARLENAQKEAGKYAPDGVPYAAREELASAQLPFLNHAVEIAYAAKLEAARDLEAARKAGKDGPSLQIAEQRAKAAHSLYESTQATLHAAERKRGADKQGERSPAVKEQELQAAQNAEFAAERYSVEARKQASKFQALLDERDGVSGWARETLDAEYSKSPGPDATDAERDLAKKDPSSAALFRTLGIRIDPGAPSVSAFERRRILSSPRDYGMAQVQKQVLELSQEPDRVRAVNALMRAAADKRLEYTKAEVDKFLHPKAPETKPDTAAALKVLNEGMNSAQTPWERERLWKEAGKPFDRGYFNKEIQNAAGAPGNGRVADKVGDWLETVTANCPPEAANEILDAVKGSFQPNWYDGGRNTSRSFSLFKGLSHAVEIADQRLLGQPPRGRAKEIGEWLEKKFNIVKNELMNGVETSSPNWMHHSYEAVEEAVSRGDISLPAALWAAINKDRDPAQLAAEREASPERLEAIAKNPWSKERALDVRHQLRTNTLKRVIGNGVEAYQTRKALEVTKNEYEDFKKDKDKFLPQYFADIIKNKEIFSERKLAEGPQLRNFIGTCLKYDPTNKTAAGQRDNTRDWYSGAALEAIRQVERKIVEAGGKTPEVTAIPMLYASDDAGIQPTAMFAVADKTASNGSKKTHKIVDDRGTGIFKDFQDFQENNKLGRPSNGHDAPQLYFPKELLPAGLATVTADGKNYQEAQAHVVTTWENIKEYGDYVAGTAAMVGGVALIATGFGAPLGGTLIATSSAATWGGMAWFGYRAAERQYNRVNHKMSISWFDPDARADWLTLAACATGGIAKLTGKMAEGIMGGAAKWTSRSDRQLWWGKTFSGTAASSAGWSNAIGYYTVIGDAIDLGFNHGNKSPSEIASEVAHLGLGLAFITSGGRDAAKYSKMRKDLIKFGNERIAQRKGFIAGNSNVIDTYNAGLPPGGKRIVGGTPDEVPADRSANPFSRAWSSIRAWGKGSYKNIRESNILERASTAEGQKKKTVENERAASIKTTAKRVMTIGGAILAGGNLSGAARFAGHYFGTWDERTGAPLTQTNARTELDEFLSSPDQYYKQNYKRAGYEPLAAKVGDVIPGVSWVSATMFNDDFPPGHLLKQKRSDGTDYIYTRVPQDMYDALKKEQASKGIKDDKIYVNRVIKDGEGKSKAIWVEVRPPYSGEMARDAGYTATEAKDVGPLQFSTQYTYGVGPVDGQRPNIGLLLNANYWFNSPTAETYRYGMKTADQGDDAGKRWQDTSIWTAIRLGIGILDFNPAKVEDITDPQEALSGREKKVLYGRIYADVGARNREEINIANINKIKSDLTKLQAFFRLRETGFIELSPLSVDIYKVEEKDGSAFNLNFYYELQFYSPDGRMQLTFSSKEGKFVDRGTSGLRPWGVAFLNDPAFQATWTKPVSPDLLDIGRFWIPAAQGPAGSNTGLPVIGALTPVNANPSGAPAAKALMDSNRAGPQVLPDQSVLLKGGQPMQMAVHPDGRRYLYDRKGHYFDITGWDKRLGELSYAGGDKPRIELAPGQTVASAEKASPLDKAKLVNLAGGQQGWIVRDQKSKPYLVVNDDVFPFDGDPEGLQSLHYSPREKNTPARLYNTGRFHLESEAVSGLQTTRRMQWLGRSQEHHRIANNDVYFGNTDGEDWVLVQSHYNRKHQRMYKITGYDRKTILDWLQTDPI